MYIHPPSLTNTHLRTYSHAYESILTARRRSPGTAASSVILLVPPEVDALCAARMLAHLFRQDDVMYRIIPVSGFAALYQVREELMRYHELHTLILINIGSVLDLPSEEWFGGEFSDKVTVHVIDSSRPLNLSSLFGGGDTGKRIVVWDDGTADTLGDERIAHEALMYEPDSDSDDGESESDSENEDEDGERPRRRRRRGSADDEDEENSDDEGPPRRRRKLDNEEKPPRLPRDVRDQYRSRLEKYYSSGTDYGQSAAGIIYVLAVTLKRADNDLLWLSILGLTHQYITSRIPRDKYDAFCQIFDDEASRLNPTGPVPTTLHPDDMCVRKSEELRFTLFRHWNLYDAMYHSSYVAGRLGIWKDKGRKRLQGLLAKMGFSLQQCQQAYAHMDMDLKQHLRGKMESIAPEYGLIELVYPSFTRSYGFRSQPLCAADVVEGITALLEAATGIRLEVEVEGGRGGGEWFGGGRLWNLGKRGKEDKDSVVSVAEERENGEEGREDGEEAVVKEETWWVKNFWVAFDALSNDIGLLRDSLPLSMALQRAIIRQGSALIEKGAVKKLRTFRLAVIKEGPDLALFSNPGPLSRLALWLVDALREKVHTMTVNGSKRKIYPFVVACLNEKAGSYLVVGTAAAPEYGDTRKNHFGLAFLQAKEQSNSRTRHGTFDTNVVEVNKEDLPMFLEGLQLRA